jgi:hypothetical protein
VLVFDVTNLSLCEFWCFHSAVIEDSGLLGCDIVLLGSFEILGTS